MFNFRAISCDCPQKTSLFDKQYHQQGLGLGGASGNFVLFPKDLSFVELQNQRLVYVFLALSFLLNHFRNVLDSILWVANLDYVEM